MFISIHPDDRECSAVMCLRRRTGWEVQNFFRNNPVQCNNAFLFAMIGGQNKQLWFCIFA